MFAIAETLNCGTVDELSERMSVSEKAEWKEYFDIKERRRNRQKNRKKTSNNKKKARTLADRR